MLKILITNAYSARNKGDAGIVAGMVRDLRSRVTFADAEITISSAVGPGETGYPAPVIHSFPSLKTLLSSDPQLQALGYLLFIHPLARLWVFCRRRLGADLPVWAPLRRLLRAYQEADLVVAAGGGYLYTCSKHRGNIVLLSVINGYRCAALLGKPVYLYSQSIGPFAGRFQAWLVRRSLRGVRTVFAREEETRKRLERWCWSRRMAILGTAADAAFLLTGATRPASLPPPPDNGIRVGLTVRRWFRDGTDQQGYEETFGHFVRWLVEEMNAAVVFVPQVTYEAGDDDDRAPARNIVALAGESPHITLVEDEMDPAGIRGLCGEMDYFVGTRMHSNIFALSMGVPALAIGYQPKSAGIMAQLGLERFVLPIENLKLKELKAGFRRLVDEGDGIVTALKKGLPRQREDARSAARLIELDFRRFQ